MSDVRHLPPAPDKELPYIIIQMFHFASDADAKKYEEEVTKWYPDRHLFLGRISGDVSGRYTHCCVYRHNNFDDYKRIEEDYESTLKDSDKVQGENPLYLFDHAYVFRVADHRDPILLKHGIDEWTRRLHATKNDVKSPDPVRRAKWRNWVSQKLAKDWGEAVTKNGWDPKGGY